MQSVHSVIVGFASCVPILIDSSEQKFFVSLWFLQFVTVHAILWFAYELFVILFTS